MRLGGVDVPFDYHLEGHSDADVVLHAVADAILGAAGLPDIGEQFPDTDPRCKGCDSRDLLTAIVAKAASAGWAVASLDIVIHAERPRLSSHKGAMQDRIAALLGLPPGRVGVKAKTNEGLDAVGRGEAVACTCVAGLRWLPTDRDS